MSGKSKFARHTLDAVKTTIVIGTGSEKDASLKDRIEALKAERPQQWHTIESQSDINEPLQNESAKFQQILLDSVNQWLAALIVFGAEKYSISQLADICDQEIKGLLDSLTKLAQSKRLVIVSAEVGHSLAPSSAIERLLREKISLLNLSLAELSSSVVKLTCGIPQIIKG